MAAGLAHLAFGEAEIEDVPRKRPSWRERRHRRLTRGHLAYSSNQAPDGVIGGISVRLCAVGLRRSHREYATASASGAPNIAYRRRRASGGAIRRLNSRS